MNTALVAKLLDMGITLVLAGFDKNELISSVNDRLGAGESLESVHRWVVQQAKEAQARLEDKIKELSIE